MTPKVTVPKSPTAQPPEFFRGEPMRKKLEGGVTLCFQRLVPKTDVCKKTVRKSLTAFGRSPDEACLKFDRTFVLPENIREPLIEFFLADGSPQDGTCLVIGKNGGEAESIEVKYKSRNNEPYVHATQAIRELAEAPGVFGIVFLEAKTSK